MGRRLVKHQTDNFVKQFFKEIVTSRGLGPNLVLGLFSSVAQNQILAKASGRHNFFKELLYKINILGPGKPDPHFAHFT